MPLVLCFGRGCDSYRRHQIEREAWSYCESPPGHDDEGRGQNGHRMAAAQACKVQELHSLDMAQDMVQEDQEVRRMGMGRSLEQEEIGSCFRRIQS